MHIAPISTRALLFSAAVLLLVSGCFGSSNPSPSQGDAGSDRASDAPREATGPTNPTIAVFDGASPVAAGSTVSVNGAVIGTPRSTAFTIRNTGTAALTIGGVTVDGADFSVIQAPASPVAAGSSTFFAIAFAPTATGTKTGTVTIANDASDGFSFTVSAQATAVPRPGIGVSVDGTGIANAGTLAFGLVNVGTAASRTLTIRNIGTQALILPSNPVVTGAAFTLTTPPPDSLLPPGGSTTCVVTFTPAATGDRTGSISIANNTPGASPYVITLTGTGTPFVYFVKQANGTTTASLAGGALTVASTYGPSGNAFKYVAPNYYGTVSNGFISFPTPMNGDFSIAANVTITAQNKANNACGVGLGMTTGFNGTDSYAYILMRNTSNVANGYYVSGAGATSAGSPTVAFTNGTPLQLTFSRTGTTLTYAAGPVGGPLTSNAAATSFFTNGTVVYGDGPAYPAISFNNVAATITNLVIKDGSGATVYDSATGAVVTYIPASLTLSVATTSMAKGASQAITATAVAVGGAASNVTAVSADPTIATTSVVNNATSSVVTVTGVKGGTTTVTVTNTSDTNPATSTKTIVVAVAEYETTDSYGSLATRVYPAPAATSAYTDGELALTFDAPPTLNTGGTIKIYKLSDGSEVDSVAFSGETQTFGSTAINVGTQLVRVSGNTVYFTPHLAKLAYATGYYVVIPTTSITGPLNAVAFNGLSNLNTVATWSFTTRAAPTLSAANVTVDGAQTSTANFRTVQGALGALAAGLPGATSVTINVAAGTYNELVRYTGPGAATPQTINIVGPAGNTRGNGCVIQYANGNGANGATQTRALAYFSGANLVLQNITLKNTAVRAALSQAESLYFASGAGFTLAANNSSFYSNQDTIQTSGRNWFYNCYIEGNVDFVWGTADAALFENCSLRFVNDLGGAAASYSLFVARTGATIASGASGTVGKGYVLWNSTVSVDANVTATFGRDAGTGPYYDQAALIGVTFTGAGTIGAGIWNVTTAPLSIGDASYVGWKSASCSGLNLATAVTDPKTSATIAAQATEYDTRDHILNRVVTVTTGVPSGYQAVITPWDVSALATQWGAP